MQSYLEICRKLPPHEWAFVDHFYVEHWNKYGIFVSTDGIITEVVFDNGISESVIWIDEAIWLPHRESDWIKMDQWPPHWGFCDGAWMDKKGWSIVDQEFGGAIVSDESSLLACAKAWEKAVTHEIQ